VLARVYLSAGEVLVWEDEPNDDVFLLASGELESLVGGKVAGTVYPGAVFGETAFFSRRPRHATVRARVPSECLVIRNLDLLSFAYKHPSVLIQMGGAFARRLEDRDALESEEAATQRWPGIDGD
jgi:CRP-like cAMP-binding protein